MAPFLWKHFAVALLAGVVRADQPEPRVYPYQQADTARRIAIEECKPLVVHFVPDNATGSEQLTSYYRGPNSVPQEILEKVVIVVLPTERFRDFANELGVTGVAGYRTISPYHLSPLGKAAKPTCRGFR